MNTTRLSSAALTLASVFPPVAWEDSLYFFGGSPLQLKHSDSTVLLRVWVPYARIPYVWDLSVALAQIPGLQFSSHRNLRRLSELYWTLSFSSVAQERVSPAS